jgi:hypothetical protein
MRRTGRRFLWLKAHSRLAAVTGGAWSNGSSESVSLSTGNDPFYNGTMKSNSVPAAYA